MAYEVDWLCPARRTKLLAAREVSHRKITADARGGESLAGMRQIFFSIITREAIRHGNCRSIKNSPPPSAPSFDCWSERCQLSTRAKTADELLRTADSARACF